MKLLCVSLNSVDEVKDFVNITNNIDGNVFISCEKYIIDAKSIMSIFSLDLSKKLNLEIENWREEYIISLEKYLSK